MQLFIAAWSCAVVLVLCNSYVHANQSLERITLKLTADGNRRFVEATSGREVILHGVNAIVKGVPYIPTIDRWDQDISLTVKDFQTLQLLGLNVIRLGVMWPGLEPVRGEYNITYLDQLEWIVRRAADFGIYTLLDMHQDVLSEAFCGEGIPGWAVVVKDLSDSKKFAAPKSAEPYTAVASDGFPTRQDCNQFNWPSYYSTYAASSAFESLYTNENGVLDAWAGFWSTVATRFRSLPSVLGYELINEPWAGDVFEDPKLLVPSVADRTRLQPAYDRLASAIRSIDSQALIFFAAVTWDDPIPVGFTSAPGGVEFADRSVFAYHFYEPPQFTNELYFRQRLNDAKRLSVGSMLTEFERANGEDAIDADPFTKTAAVADEFLQSWAMWEMKTFCKESEESLVSDSQQAVYGSCKTGYGSRLIWKEDSEELNPLPCEKLARTYAQFTAGNATKMSFDALSKRFELHWQQDANIASPTIVYVDTLFNYPHGVKVTVTPAHLFRAIQQGNRIAISPLEMSSIRHGSLVQIVVDAV